MELDDPGRAQRIFLGWDHPALPAAAAHLIDHYVDGGIADLRSATIVLPGRRARRRIIELLLDKASARGATLVPPTATTVGNLPTELHQSPRPLADDVTSHRAWSRALRSVSQDALKQVFPHLPKKSNLADWDELAGLLSGLHQSVAGEGHRFSDVAKICHSGILFDDGTRWGVMAHVQDRYLLFLDQAGLADRFEVRMAALESEVAPFKGDLWFISIVELPAVTRRLVEASGADVHTLIHAPAGPSDGVDTGLAFDNFGLPSTEYWERARVPVTDEVLRVVESPADQADTVIDSLITLDGQYAAEDVVLAVHVDSGVVPYLEQRLEARGVTPRYAAGTPLSHTAPLRLLEAVGDYREDRSFLSLAALLRHPDAGPLTQTTTEVPTRLEAVDAADLYFNDHLPFRLQGTLPVGERRAARFPHLVRALERTGPLSHLKGRKRLSEWMPLIRDVLLTAYGDRNLDRSKPAHRRLLDTLSRIRTVAVAVATLPDPLDEECSCTAAIRTLLLELRGEALPPEPRRDAVELLDWLELPLDDAPVVMLTGFNEGLLPESVSGHAFLPDALRSRLGLIDNRRRLARDAYRLTTVLHSKESVRLIAGRRTGQGDPLRPSRLMFRIPEEEMAARVLTFLKGDGAGPVESNLSSLGLQPGAESQFTVPPEPVLEVEQEEVPTKLRVTDFKSVLADPYRFVLERIYDLDSVDHEARELDPLGFGILAHDVLQAFGQMALESPPPVDITDAAAVANALVKLLDDKVSTRFGSDALPAVALQVEQLRTRLGAFAEKQAEWASLGWRIIAVEQQAEGDGIPFDVDGEPMLLRGRIDRIDHNRETGDWAVLDYKTGNSVKLPDDAHRKGRGDDREWIDLQLPLYHRLLPGIVDERGRQVVSADATGDGRIELGYVSLPSEPDKSAFMLAPWTEAELASAEEAARDVIRTLRQRTFEFDPTVTKPSFFGGDPLEPLLARGWQSADDDDSGTRGDETRNEGGNR
jgi:hypothetical protein